MPGLILAGGSGTRLNRGEKPLVDICGQPMIWHVIHAFRQSGCEPLVVLSQQTPYTANWCRVNRVGYYLAGSGDYMGDIIEAVEGLGEEGPVLVSACDLPAIDGAILRAIGDAYTSAGLPALSTWVPVARSAEARSRISLVEEVSGVAATPSGINILSGDRIRETQPEHRFLLDDWRVALNVNTPEALGYANRTLGRRTFRACGPD